MEILEKIFGSTAKVKMMRMFLFNPTAIYDVDDMVGRTQLRGSEVRKELSNMEKMGMLRKKSFYKDVVVRGKDTKKRSIGWYLNSGFPFSKELQALLVTTVPIKSGEIVRRLNRAGKIKLIIVAGIFIQDSDSRVDLLVVGDEIKKGTLENTIRHIESEVGKELRYTSFETDDFKYRLGVYDKLIRDILDYPHHVIVDKMGLK